MKKYTEFLNERKKHKLTAKDNLELHDFLNHVLNNMDEEPNLLRSAYARIQGILREIRSGNCPKDKLISFFQTILLFIEGHGRNIKELKEWSEKLLSIDGTEYDVLLSIIYDYNHLVNKYKNSDFNGQVFNIRSWAFELEGVEPYEEIIENWTGADIQDLFMNGDLDWTEQQALKDSLPTKKIDDIDDDREWKVGDILLDGETHYLVVENYEDYCDFGCGYIASFLAQNPDINEEEFGEYVSQHNKADRDMGELQDVCEEEIERLGKEFKSKSVKENNNYEEEEEDDSADIDRIYKASLDDEYWKNISVKFPKYNDPGSDDNIRAIKYVYRHMKETYPNEKWNSIRNEMEDKISGGIT